MLGCSASKNSPPAKTSSPTKCCVICHTTTTPMWRRNQSGQQVCNACGLKPTGGKTSLPKAKSINSKQAEIECFNCKAKETSLWRRDPDNNHICNACGLHYRLYGTNRSSVKPSVVKKRKRLVVPTEYYNENGSVENAYRLGSDHSQDRMERRPSQYSSDRDSTVEKFSERLPVPLTESSTNSKPTLPCLGAVISKFGFSKVRSRNYYTQRHRLEESARVFHLMPPFKFKALEPLSPPLTDKELASTLAMMALKKGDNKPMSVQSMLL
jgi:hypothetical protein